MEWSEIWDKISEIFGYHTDRVLKRMQDNLLAGLTLQVIASQSGTVDANGNCSIQVYVNSTQRNLVIGRVVLNASGFTPASPHTAGNGEWAGIFGGPGALLTSMRDALPRTNAGQMFPQIAEYSGHNALRFRGGENVFFELRSSSITANTPITVTIYGALEPASSDYDL